MPVHKSIIEDFELESGTGVFIQANDHSAKSRIVISFDGTESSYNITLNADEAQKLVEHLQKVVEHVNG